MSGVVGAVDGPKAAACGRFRVGPGGSAVATCRESFGGERAVSGGTSPPLVITGKSAHPPSPSLDGSSLAVAEKIDDFAVSRSRRYGLQRIAKNLLPSHPVGGCLWHIARGENGVEVEYSPSTGRARYRKLQTCGSVWVCPVCAGIVSERRADEIRAGLAALTEAGGSAAFATFTVAHGRGDSLERVLEGFLAAFRRLTAKPSYQRLRKRYGVVGYVRVLEVTHGKNGWHPHTHVLFCFDRVLGEDEVGRFSDEVYPLWESACAGQGLSMSRRYGLHVVPAYGTVEDYLAKFGHPPRWDVSRELTKGHIKAGRSLAGSLSLSPMQLLEAAGAGDAACGRLFVEFAARFNGKAQLYWSPGLRARLLPGDEAASDAAVVAAADEAARLALALTPPEWEAVKRVPDGRPRVLGLVEADRGRDGQARAFVARAVALHPAPPRRDLTKMDAGLRAAVAVLAAEQLERNRWRGPVPSPSHGEV